ncbi:uncharacterized protein LOC132612928 [Lycium barbarum]|uniref:uncharacterized protein LOC132612928 n=1 Tax=Lycium barbarum TaxID=112863 RepID=UPI00293F455B|nr:uncharacterized protein LOC132612928 [Lycium barbarum]
MYQQLSTYRPKLYYAKVLWRMPLSGRLKCNTDGASRGNPGRSSYGFCIRDSRGDLVYAQAKDIGIKENTEAEAEGSWTTPWELKDIVEDIKEGLRFIQGQSMHTFREGNKLAGFLANQALDNEDLELNSFADVPREGSKIIDMDKSQIPQLRIKTRRISRICS